MSYLEQQYARGGAGSGAGSGAGAIWEQIRGLCSKTLGAMAAQLDGGPALPVDAIGLGPEELWSPSRKGVSVWDNVQTGGTTPDGARRSKCFHLLGIDVILSADGRVHLLEVNCNPSLGIDEVHVTEAARHSTAAAASRHRRTHRGGYATGGRVGGQGVPMPLAPSAAPASTVPY